MRIVLTSLLLIGCGVPDPDPSPSQTWHGFLYDVTSCWGDVLTPPAFVTATGEAEWTLELYRLRAKTVDCAPEISARDGGLDVVPAACGAGRIDRGRLEPQPDGGLAVDIETSATSSSSVCRRRVLGNLILVEQ